MTRLRFLAMAMGGFCLSGMMAFGGERPNILWITCEDTLPHLGCYGDAQADTPHLDAFARDAIRYTRAFAYTGVCAPSRSCLITGVYPLRLGTQGMRSNAPLPEEVVCFPALLRKAGYYCTNQDKEDYNFKTPGNVWDASNRKAHYKNRAPGQPFFSVFNLGVCHQSRIFLPDVQAAKQGNPPPPTRHDPGAVEIPPIHPDTPTFRREWARQYDNVTEMDRQAGALLAELESEGLQDNTIVFFFSDHGTGMPGIKMFAWGPSLQVPLLIRFPEKFRSFASGPPGSTCTDLVSFVDFAPTVLGLCGVSPPPAMQGFSFLGPDRSPPRTRIFGGKDRQAECTDLIRYVRDARFQYNRNFMPHLPFGQYMSYLMQHASTREWLELHEQGALQGPPARFFAPTKPVEELYDVEKDPWQVNNLASDPAFAAELQRMRSALREEMLQAGDLGLLPEGEMFRRSNGNTPYGIATDPTLNPIDALLKATHLANAMDPGNGDALAHLATDPDPALRWWGITGLAALKELAKPHAKILETACQDSSPLVCVAAAEGVYQLGQHGPALEALRGALESPDVFVRLSALQVLQRLGPGARPLIKEIQATRTTDAFYQQVASYVKRLVDYLPPQL